MVEKMQAVLETFASYGSGWVLQHVIQVFVKLAKFSPIRGSSYFDLPFRIRTSQNLINIRNHEDNNCFELCFTAAYSLKHGVDLLLTDQQKANPAAARTQPDTYTAESAHKAQGNFDSPMSFASIGKFEQLNDVRVNVFQYHKGDLLPMYISKRPNQDNSTQTEIFDMDLLLLYEPAKHHYVLIIDLLKFICEIKGCKYRTIARLCRNCFHISWSDETHEQHIQCCKDHEPALVVMPSAEKGTNRYEFKNLQALWFVPLVIYFDFESFLKPVDSCPDNPSQSSTRVLQKHEACGYSLAVIEHENSQPYFFDYDSSDQCMKKFLNQLHQLAREIYDQKRRFPQFLESQESLNKENTSTCWICCIHFTNEHEKCLDHCHFSGNVLGWAHEKCNLARRTVNFTPVIGHNIQNYDLHHICLALHECEPTSTMSVIPSTDKKYISLSIGVLIKTIKRKNGSEQKVFEYLRFIDSCKFLNSSLQKLVDNLPAEKMSILNKYFANETEEQRCLIRQKGFYPYSYMTGREKFAEKELPPLQNWSDVLNGGKVAVSQADLEHAKKVFRVFKCQNLEDYHNLYLKCDTLLLACGFEEFRQISHQTYGLDCAHHFSASNLAGDAFKRICKDSNVQLLSDRRHLEMVENMMRGGTASVFHSRFFKANNKECPDFNPDQPSTYGFMIDANNLYGGVMQTEKLPVRNFELIEHIEDEVIVNQILNMTEDSLIGFILEVDLEYPEELHEDHQDYPLAPTKESVPQDWLSPYQTNLLEQMKNQDIARRSIGKTKKLLQTLHDKSNYTIHYKLLQLFVRLGLKVKKVHRVLKFGQEAWLEPYITLNTTKRQQARNKFEEDLYKLLNNCAYGKACESKRKRMLVRIVRDYHTALREISAFEFKSYKIFGENLAAFTSNPTKIYWDVPTIVGASVLELAKFHMYKFHNDIMKPNFECQLLYSDTDSLLY